MINPFRMPHQYRRTQIQPTIQVYHNAPVPFDDIFAVLSELFGTIYPTNDIAKMITTVDHVFSAYDRQGRCVAAALLTNLRNQNGLYLMLFGVRQFDQGRGTGTFLLGKIIRWARRTGYGFIYLHVHVENVKAIGLYEKVGFKKDAFLPNFYEHTPKQPAHAYRMILRFY